MDCIDFLLALLRTGNLSVLLKNCLINRLRDACLYKDLIFHS